MTTENSRADALTDGQILEIAEVVRLDVLKKTHARGNYIISSREFYVGFARAILAACPVERPAAAPIEAISKLLAEAMDRAAANGADSRSMPDEYVAIAHFTCYPEEYGYAKPAPSPADERANSDGMQNFACYLIDNCEGETITEESIQAWLGSALRPRYARAASANETGAEGAKPCAEGRMPFNLTHEQVSALYLLLFRRVRPEFGWMEEPLVAIEAALKPAHDAIHDRGFNAMNRQFFGDDRMALDEARMPDQIAPRAGSRSGRADGRAHRALACRD